MFLSIAVSTLQKIAKFFTSDINEIVFIDNWMPWIVVVFFASGWFLTHWIEIALFKNQTGLAKFLLFAMFAGSILISAYFEFVSDNRVLDRFGIASLFLVFGGHYLRLSMFQNDNLLRLKQVAGFRKM